MEQNRASDTGPRVLSHRGPVMFYVGTRPGHTPGHIGPGRGKLGQMGGNTGNSDKTLWLFMEMSHGMKHTMFFCVWVSVSGSRTVRQRAIIYQSPYL